MSKLPAPIEEPDELFEQQRRRYQKHRRAYPREIFELIHESLRGLAAPEDTQPPFLIDLGCGTGQLTRSLSREFPRARIVGLDSSAAMIDMAREALSKDPAFAGRGVRVALPQFECARAEKIPYPDGSASLVTAATTFHWFERDVALSEIMRILRPKGIFAALNIDIPHVNDKFQAWWKSEQEYAWRPYLHPKLEHYFEMPSVVSDPARFEPVKEFRFSNTHSFTAPELAEWVLTTSFGSQTARAHGEETYTQYLLKSWEPILPQPPESFAVDFPVFGLIQRRH